MHFYELHEGDGEDFGDLLLVRDEEMDPDDFFELVQEIRRRMKGSFEQETLIEAIAVELERDHGFLFISDDRLTAAINVSKVDGDNFLADLDETYDPRHAGADPDADDEDEQGEGDDEPGADDGDFRSILADFDPRGTAEPN